MDIWAWHTTFVNDLRRAGRGDLAAEIDAFPDHVIEQRYDRVDASAPNLLAAARALGNTWLEVWVRHWTVIATRARGRASEALAESVSLLEFSHRDESRDCPQSVCTVQDICLAYGAVDGPGYVAERIAVCEETLARIDPTWDCFDCITSELANAHADADEYVTAVEVRRDAERRMGGSTHPVKVGSPSVWLARLDRFDEAHALLDQATNLARRSGSPTYVRAVALQRASILAAQGQFAEAAAVVPTYPVGTDGEGSPLWCRVQELLAAHDPSRNTWRLGDTIQRYLAARMDGGAHGTVVRVAAAHTRLAVARGARSTAERALEAFETHRQHLRDPNRLATTSVELGELVAAMPSAATLPVPADELIAHLATLDAANPERDLDWLVTAALARPDDSALAVALGNCRYQLGLHRQALSALEQFVVDHPAAEEPALACGFLHRSGGDAAGLARIAELIANDQPQNHHWLLAHRALDADDHDAVADHCAAIVAGDDSVVNTRVLWAASAMRAERWAQARDLRLAAAERLEARGDAPGPLLWGAMIPATILGDWATVRNSARRVGFELDEGDAPIAEQWELIRLRLPPHEPTAAAESGPIVLAVRISPVSARVLTVAATHHAQHTRDIVVFDATPVETPPQDEEERRNFRNLYGGVRIIERAGYRGFEFVGGWPGTEAWAAMFDLLNAHQWEMRTYSSDEFRLTGPDGESIEAVGGFLAVGPDDDLVEVDRLLGELTADWPRPWVWPYLRGAAELDTADQWAAVDTYGIIID